MASNMYFKPRKVTICSFSYAYKLCTALFILVLLSVPIFFLLYERSSALYFSSPAPSTTSNRWAGDLRTATFAWNRLSFEGQINSRHSLKIAVFCRRWPAGSIPGGMERHAYTLHSTMADRGHRVHVFTSPYTNEIQDRVMKSSKGYPFVHFHGGEVGKWRSDLAWAQYKEENDQDPFDVVHTESVSLPHQPARLVPNLVVTWHGNALESLQSSIYQDLASQPEDPMSPSFYSSLEGVVPKVIKEIRFFHNYTHHVAISDSSGEMLRDVYEIPSRRVHVIINGVNESEFREDFNLGEQFRSKIGLPKNATLVLGVAGRLVKDKGHPLLYVAFSRFMKRHPDVYLVVAGSGPWEKRYKNLGPQVVVLGALNSSELVAFYNAIDMFLNPTLRPQGLDLTLMEAMISGTPVMASRFPSIKETIVVKEELGVLFVPNVEPLIEALEEVVEEGHERLKERGKACREYATSMFTSHKMALAYERLFLCVKNETFCTYP